jgi:hypothetical protein
LPGSLTFPLEIADVQKACNSRQTVLSMMEDIRMR